MRNWGTRFLNINLPTLEVHHISPPRCWVSQLNWTDVLNPQLQHLPMNPVKASAERSFGKYRLPCLQSWGFGATEKCRWSVDMCGESMDILKHLQILYSVILWYSMCIPFFDVVFLLKLKVLGEQVVSSITSEQRASASTARAAWVIVKSATHGLMETAHWVGAEKSEILAH